LPAGLRATSDLAEIGSDVAIVLVAVPSHGFRAVLEQLAGHVSRDVAVVSLTKGIESSTNSRMSQVIRAVLPSNPVGVLTGPNLAREIAEGQPAASVVALEDPNSPSSPRRRSMGRRTGLHEHRRHRLRGSRAR